MQNRFIIGLAVWGAFMAAGCTTPTSQDQSGAAGTTAEKKVAVQDTDKGIGQYADVALTHPLDMDMVARGEKIYKAKCFACHKLTDEKLVGPGWADITDRRTPEWIMNFQTNTNVMLDSDLIAQQLMVVCIARMPNQNLTGDEARDMLEFMRQNDGKN